MHLAIDHGARVVTTFDLLVTHIVVDKTLTEGDIRKELKLIELPEGVTVVDESWVPACISCKDLVSVSQPRFQVITKAARPGLASWMAPHQRPPYRETPLPVPSATEGAPSQTSDRSLQLKPAKGKDARDLTYEPRTPSRTDEESQRTPWTESDQSGRGVGPTESARAQAAAPVQKNARPLDALEEAIEEARNVEELPKGIMEEEELGSSTHRFDRDSDSERAHSPSPGRPISKQSKDHSQTAGDWQQKFSCMQAPPSKDQPNPNARTIALLKELESYYQSTGDEWRTRSFGKAQSILRRQTRHITTKDEALALPGIGESIATKIEEIVWTNNLKRLENARLEPTDKALSLFLDIHGVGFTIASKWVQEGHRTIHDLLTSPNVKLNANQKIGIEHYDDFKKRIPREENEQLGRFVRARLRRIDNDICVIMGGSYRRGAATSGDLDLIITRKGADAAYLRETVLGRAVPWLTKVGFLTAALQGSSAEDKNGSKWQGACQLPMPGSPPLSRLHPNDSKTNSNPWRRIDLLLVPWDELGAAMIYFTGDDVFNRSMRLLARKKGMRLNQRGLYKDCLRHGAAKVAEGTKISGHEEKEIFEILGVPWRGPTERNC